MIKTSPQLTRKYSSFDATLLKLCKLKNLYKIHYHPKAIASQVKYFQTVFITRYST